MYATVAAIYISAYCRETFEDPEGMECTAAQGSFLDAFDHNGFSSHKYYPKRLNEELGLPDGAGVYGGVLFSDGSHLLMTCGGKLAVWSGKSEDKAEWRPNPHKEKI